MRRGAFSSCASTKLSYLALAFGLDGPATVAMTDLLRAESSCGRCERAAGLPLLYFDASAAQQDLSDDRTSRKRKPRSGARRSRACETIASWLPHCLAVPGAALP